MPQTFSLDRTDEKLLERVVAARFHRKVGRLNVSMIVQYFAWFFIGLAVMTFFKQWERTPQFARPYGMMLLFAVIGFLFAVIRPYVEQWLCRRHVAGANDAFTEKQSVWFQDGSLVLESLAGRSFVPPSAIIDYSIDERNHYLFLTGAQAIVIPRTVAVALGTDFTEYLGVRDSNV